MPDALAVVAHHDDHILWMGGTLQRTLAAGWRWKLVAMCVPEPAKQMYYHACCRAIGTGGSCMVFQDYQAGSAFSRNQRAAMEGQLLNAIQANAFDYVFTHSRHAHGEYGGAHANHIEVREIVETMVRAGQIGKGAGSLAYFSYDLLYGGGGKATAAITNSDYFLQLTYPELMLKCHWCQQAPDANTNLANLGFPCPNPEAFEGDGLTLPAPFMLP